MKYQTNSDAIHEFIKKCESESIQLPQDIGKVLTEVGSALNHTNGNYDEALQELKKKFGVVDANKRKQPEDSNDQQPHHHKRARLVNEILEAPANVPANQKLVDAFLSYAENQLDRGHTGKGSSHLRAALEIREFDEKITSGAHAKAKIGYIGDLMASQIDEVLKSGKLTDSSSEDLNISRQESEYNEPPLVREVRETPAKRKENQKIVDALADYAEEQLKSGNTGKGSSHIRAARQIHNADIVIHQAGDARQIGYIGDTFIDKIDQILKHGRIVHDTDYAGSRSRSTREGGAPAPIVQDLRNNPAKCKENQVLVDRLTEYGDYHLYTGHRGKGISHLRSAVQIRNAEKPIRSGADAKQLGYVGNQVAMKVDQILRTGNADDDPDYEEGSDEGYEYEDEDEEAEGDEAYGKANKMNPPIVNDIRSAPAKCTENQKLVDALTVFGEEQLQQAHTGRGVSHLRAAKSFRDCEQVITSGNQARKIGLVGRAVASKVDEILSK